MQAPVRWPLLLLLVGLIVVGVLFWPQKKAALSAIPAPCEAVDSLTYARQLSQVRRQKDSLFREAEASPIPPEARPQFEGLHYYAPNQQWCLQGTFRAATGSLLPVIGYLTLNLPTLDNCRSPATLLVYGDAQGQNPYLAFWDSTAALGETYENGRYVPLVVRGDTAEVDFNRAYFPFCAYNPRYICHLPPPTNRFCVYIRAGECWARAADSSPFRALQRRQILSSQ